MSQVLGIDASTSLVPYNQASVSLAYSYSIPINQLNPNARGGRTAEIDPQPVQPSQNSQQGSLDAALAAGLLVPNPRSVTSSNQANPSQNSNNSPLVSLGVAAQAISNGQTFQYYNAANSVDNLNTNSVYSPVTPIYNFPPAYLNNSYTQVAKQTPPSTASSALLQSLKGLQGKDYGTM